LEIVPAVVKAWIRHARARLDAGTFGAEDLDLLAAALETRVPRVRQRLLYLHAREPSPTAEVVAWAMDPFVDAGAAPGERPYRTVLAAIDDGWQVIHFPQQLAPFDDAETDLVGYEFVLQKLEARNDG
jgi:hypothetical protein